MKCARTELFGQRLTSIFTVTTIKTDLITEIPFHGTTIPSVDHGNRQACQLVLGVAGIVPGVNTIHMGTRTETTTIIRCSIGNGTTVRLCGMKWEKCAMVEIKLILLVVDSQFATTAMAKGYVRSPQQ